METYAHHQVHLKERLQCFMKTNVLNIVKFVKICFSNLTQFERREIWTMAMVTAVGLLQPTKKLIRKIIVGIKTTTKEVRTVWYFAHKIFCTLSNRQKIRKLCLKISKKPFPKNSTKSNEKYQEVKIPRKFVSC